jgi:apolipoprotein N-acyltransferase
MNYSLFRLILAVVRKRETRQGVMGFCLSCLALLLVCLYGILIISREPLPGATSAIAVLQGNIPRDEKWDPKYLDRNMDVYFDLAARAMTRGADLVVWPETVLGPFILQDDNRYLPRMRLMNMQAQAEMLFGGSQYEGDAKSFRLYNAAFLVTPAEGIKQAYRKIILMPFSEYVPEWTFDFLKKRLRFPRDVSAGREHTVFESSAGRFSALICFEIVFSGHARKFVENGAQFLINISNDGWYSESALSYQQVSMACLTAVENGVWVVRCDNNGLSGFISPKGAVVEQIPFDRADTLSQQIALRRETTFYTAHGNIFARICAFISLIFLGSSMVFLVNYFYKVKKIS